MFPTECLMVRRDRKKKIISPIFLGDDAEEYFILVMDCFRKNIGRRKHDIEHDLKEVELKVQYNKVIKGLSEVIFRLSKSEKLTAIEPSELRNKIFLRFPNGIPSPDERADKLKAIAKELNITPKQIEDSLYADKEGEQIISEIPKIPFEEVSKLYNLEQAETLLSKSTGVLISGIEDWGLLIKRIRRLGLLFNVNQEKESLKSIYVSGPASINENTHRYGSRIAQLLHVLLRFKGWRLEADVEFKDERSDGKFKMFLSYAGSDMFPDFPQDEPAFVPNYAFVAHPMAVGGRFVFPDYVISRNGEEILLFISRLIYLDSDTELKTHLDQHGRKSLFVYSLEKGEKKKKGLMCFSGDIPWDALFVDQVEHKVYPVHDERGMQNGVPELSKRQVEDIKKEIEPIISDFNAVMDIIRSKGFDPEQFLKALGYRIDWKTLEPTIIPE